MTPEIKEFVEKYIYPIIKAKVREQLNVTELPISVSLAIDEEGRECLNINDGHKVMMMPILTPEMKNVTNEVDLIGFKRYLLSDDQNTSQEGAGMEV